MKKSKFTEQQIAFALRQAETGTKVKETRPADGEHRADLLLLESVVRRASPFGVAEAAAARGRDSTPQESRRGPLTRQAHVARAHLKKL
jgi:hypothetical protein